MIAFCLLLVNINTAVSFSTPEYELIYSNGWIPITIDKVYNNRKDEQSNKDNNVSIIKLNIVKTPEPVVVEKVLNSVEDSEHCNGDINICQPINIESLELQNDFTPNILNIKDNDGIPDIATKRRSKKIADTSRINNKAFDLEQETNKNINTYEVVENIKEDGESIDYKQTGYTYEKPNKNDFINRLINVLLKYNIRINDQLPHYALSRRVKAGNNPLKQDYRFQSQNSLNHLPVDPLMAVFLSNYGYYLQDRHRIRDNYNNLYGYLASNNIHNNKPFGFYKIFSDTDSSN